MNDDNTNPRLTFEDDDGQVVRVTLVYRYPADVPGDEAQAYVQAIGEALRRRIDRALAHPHEIPQAGPSGVIAFTGNGEQSLAEYRKRLIGRELARSLETLHEGSSSTTPASLMLDSNPAGPMWHRHLTKDSE